MPFKAFDVNGDGVVTKGEFLATHRSMFMRFDANSDQTISLPEFAKAQEAAAQK